MLDEKRTLHKMNIRIALEVNRKKIYQICYVYRPQNNFIVDCSIKHFLSALLNREPDNLSVEVVYSALHYV